MLYKGTSLQFQLKIGYMFVMILLFLTMFSQDHANILTSVSAKWAQWLKLYELDLLYAFFQIHGPCL